VEADAARGSAQRTSRPILQHHEVAGRDLVLLHDRLARRIQLQICRIDDHINVCQLAHFAKLLGGEGRVRRPASTEHVNIGDVLASERFKYFVCHVGVVELIGRLDQNARHVEGDVADANDHGSARRPDQLIDLGCHEMITDAELVGVRVYVGMAAIPRHQVGRGHAPSQLLTGNLKPSVTTCAVRVDDRVDRFSELINADVGADGHIAVEPD
jgi:hypothetical protein